MKRKVIRLSLDKELKNVISKEKQYTVPVFIPHKGCRNDCVFCNQKKISGATKQPTAENVDSIIKTRLSELKENKTKRKIQIAFFGGSFTGLEIPEQIKYLEIANKYVLSGEVSSIRLSTRPDYINIKVLKILKKYNVKSIELGVQSCCDEVLEASKRGHSMRDVIRASRLIKLFGFSLGHQIMIGLPKSTAEREVETIKKSLALGIEDLRIYPVYVIEPTELYEMYEEKKYIPLTLEEATFRCYLILKECQNTDVKVIRMGLQSTDEITVNNKKVVGPVCDNFAEYALSRLIRDAMEDEVIKNANEEIEEFVFSVPSRYISLVAGPKKINKIYFENKYNMKIKITGEIK